MWALLLTVVMPGKCD